MSLGHLIAYSEQFVNKKNPLDLFILHPLKCLIFYTICGKHPKDVYHISLGIFDL